MSDEEGSGQEEAAFDFETNNTASTISRTDDEPFQFDGLPDLSEDESGHFKVPHVPSGLEPPKYNQHWVKPVFLNYEYIYDYRKNYYDDYIDYMDKRNQGIYREKPRPQEWAERAIRTYDEKNKNKSIRRTADMGLIAQHKKPSRYYSYHTRAYYGLVFKKIL